MAVGRALKVFLSKAVAVMLFEFQDVARVQVHVDLFRLLSHVASADMKYLSLRLSSKGA